ncbi:MAG TPA: site-specific DNA-methyltransferase [Thermodesulfobacteriota bacterium]|nr:site-specific DNA-methyltransferase [Thermodesulfobacteriota bacterium]
MKAVSRGRQNVKQANHPGRLETVEIIQGASGFARKPNRLIQGDNLEVMRGLLSEGLEGKINLIYIDPPFLSKAAYTQKILVAGSKVKRPAYSDRWTTQGYIRMLYPRLAMMKRLLSLTGKIFVHCDRRANSHIRLILDELFGEENFLNEIVWHYGGRGAKYSGGQFPRNHDTIYAYGKTKKAKLKKLYSEKRIPLKAALSSGYRQGGDGRVFRTAPRGDYTDKSIKELSNSGRVHRTSSGKVRIKYFVPLENGMVIEKKPLDDVWDDIPDAMHISSSERTGFATQKPELLLERIIESGSDEGDLVADFFSGSGTTGVAATRLKRRWLLCEKTPIGAQVSLMRLLRKPKCAMVFEKTEGKNLSDNRGRLIIKKSFVPEKKTGAVNASVSLSGYKPGSTPKWLPLAAIKNPLSLIEYWAIDWDYDGVAFKNQWRSFGETLEKKARVILEKKPALLAVRAMDVMGNEIKKALNIR